MLWPEDEAEDHERVCLSKNSPASSADYAAAPVAEKIGRNRGVVPAGTKPGGAEERTPFDSPTLAGSLRVNFSSSPFADIPILAGLKR